MIVVAGSVRPAGVHGRPRPAVVHQSGAPDASRPPGHGEVHRRVGVELAGRRVAPPPGSRGHRQAVQVGRGLVGEDGIRASAQERGEVIGGESVPGLGQAQVGPARARACPLPVDALPDPLQVRAAGAVGRQPQSGQVRGQQDGGLVGRQRSHDARHAPIGRRRRGTWGALAAAGGRRAGRAPLCRSRRPPPCAAVVVFPPPGRRGVPGAILGVIPAGYHRKSPPQRGGERGGEGRAAGRVRRVSSRAAPRSVRRSGRRGGGPRPRPWWSCGGTAGSARRRGRRPSRSAPPRRPAARSRACPR